MKSTKENILSVVVFALSVVPALIALLTGNALAFKVTQYTTVLLSSVVLAYVAEIAVSFYRVKRGATPGKAKKSSEFIMSQAVAFLGRSKLKGFTIALRSALSAVLLIALGLNALAALALITTVMVYMARGYCIRYASVAQFERSRAQRNKPRFDEMPDI